ncbi:hypothetical protein ABI_14900 [Asticcacaulis biprosthecium C19]|uniref:DUF2145 domain-containing protein n=1 Tax=Asticcacaulis biprosthecium C19 TaxID=715226 RepID=F4QIY8_9CAUL|nr:DUF2145 domain-containing protein [Asticcacaulis biprosthecium]EGF93051.1 hypothetical protein ABI_14900 [Asticcacaulis biprosthecium C19]
MTRRLLPVTLALLLLGTPAFAADPSKPVADSGFSGRAATAHYSAPEAAAFAKQIERDLAAKGARVAIVFRAGKPRNKLPEGVSYTHGAFWVYGDIQGGDGKIYKGYSSWNLYQSDGKTLPADQSYLAQDFPIDFISGNQADDVGIIIPTPEMQQKLIAVIMSPAYARLHVPSYSLVSNPFDPKHQNCTEFVLDVVATATWGESDYAVIKSKLAQSFTPTTIRANGFERFFGPLVNPLLKMDDQRGPIITTTYDSIASFMTANGQVKTNYVLQRES